MFLSMFLAVSFASRFNLLNNTCDPSSFEEGVVIDPDTPNGVIKNVVNLDAPKDCCAACASQTGCLTWTFRGDKKPSKCRLRSLPPSQRKSKKGATSGSMSSRPSPAPAPFAPPPLSLPLSSAAQASGGLVHAYTTVHSERGAAVCFSPVNRMLLCTAGGCAQMRANPGAAVCLETRCRPSS